ncbi:ABC transporter ATP-binding protein [Corynebacterium sp.]|uniref:ABC transporter ATP-binding protein n=1 Tax=Corynebacterium sp. TaxID=1720 RepID=UPI0028AA9F1B|nr:ABC transporter ATP-binding protein [Corynebacterium sp.]
MATDDQLNAGGGTTPAPGTVSVRNLHRSFDGTADILAGIDLDIAAGEFVALLGRSGSGKSTLLRALAGLDSDVTGHGVVEVPERVSVVFQDSRLVPWLRIAQNVAFGLPSGGATTRNVREALAEVGLSGRERAWPVELSGGEQQRAALGRALVREPELLLADEPFGALDALTKIRMHGLVRDLVARHRPSVMMITHDVDEAVTLADRVIVLKDGELSLQCTTDGKNPDDLRSRLLEELGEEAVA